MALTLLLVVGETGAQSGETKEPFTELGETLASSIRHADIVEYASCWLSSRAGNAAATESSSASGTPKSTGPKGYIQRRNKQVASSFAAIEEMVHKYGIDRKSVTLSSIDAKIDRDRKGRVHDFKIAFDTNAGKVELAIDDGALVDRLWYFTDAPLAVYFEGREQWVSSRGARVQRSKDDSRSAVEEIVEEPRDVSETPGARRRD